MLSRFEASAQQHQPVEEEAFLARGSCGHPAELSGLASGGSLHPGRAASMLLQQAGGVSLVIVQTQNQVLQAKMVSRPVEPESRACKLFQGYWLYQPPIGQQPRLQDGPEYGFAHNKLQGIL